LFWLLQSNSNRQAVVRKQQRASMPATDKALPYFDLYLILLLELWRNLCWIQWLCKDAIVCIASISVDLSF
jgi:hypothetical protein